MFVRLSALLPIAALLAVAAAGSSESGSGQCNTGEVQCCDNTFMNNDSDLTNVFSLFAVVLPDVEGLVGAGCTSITGIGASSGGTCSSQPVCCEGDTFNGLFNYGCNAFTGSV